MTTIAQVASRARVSQATVSRVINGTATVTSATEERVRSAVEALDYRPSRLARDLSLGSASAVAVVAQSAEWGLLAPMTRLLAERDLDVAFVEADGGVDAGALGDVLDRVGGVVTHSAAYAALSEAAARHRLPVVVVGPADPTLNRIIIDIEPALAAIGHHLASTGHSSAALFDDGTWTNSRVADLRLRFRDHGVRLVRPLRQLEALASRGRDTPSAVLATTPPIALRTHSQARALGYLIPHDLEIVALCSDPSIAAMGISTIRRPIDLAGQAAVDLIGSLMSRPSLAARPGVELRVAASFVRGVTTRRGGDHRPAAAQPRSG